MKEEKGIARAEIIRKEDGRFLRLDDSARRDEYAQ